MTLGRGLLKGDAMKTCTKCEQPKPLSDFDLYPSGTVKAKCKACYADYRRQWRMKKAAFKIKERPDYMPECTQMRHPNPLVMEGNVMKAMKKVHDELTQIAHLGFEPEAGLVDIILKDMT
jgi:hypothetical protein